MTVSFDQKLFKNLFKNSIINEVQTFVMPQGESAEELIKELINKSIEVEDEDLFNYIYKLNAVVEEGCIDEVMTDAVLPLILLLNNNNKEEADIFYQSFKNYFNLN